MLLRFLILALILMTTSIYAQVPPIEPGVSRDLAKWRAANYSDVRYKLNITLEKGAPLMKGTIEIRVDLTDEGAKNDLILDWRTTQFQNDKDKPFAKVIAVNEKNVTKVSGIDSVNYYISNEHLGISRFLLKPGENIVKIEFASPIKTSGAAVTRYVDKEDGAEYVYSLFVPSDASTAFPVFDQPDLKARFDLNLEVPTIWEAVSNTPYYVGSAFDLRDKDRKKSFHFTETKPISTYVFAFAAGDFAEFEDKESLVPSKLYVRKSQAAKLRNANSRSADGSSAASAKARANLPASNESANKTNNDASRVGGRAVRAPIDEVFRLNREGVKFLEDWFDYKFPFPKYDLVLIPEFPFGGMEHTGATFLREDRVIFPTEPTKNDYITRANVIFHEAAHQWFGDTVTMRWFDDLWLKEGFAEFMAYKTLEKVMPEYNAWKVFYERNKQAAYLTDVTRGTTPIYQEIPNLASAKSAYGNIVYRKAPSFLRQAEFYLGEKEFQTAVRAFLKKHEFANATWEDLIKEFQTVSWSTEAYPYFAELSPQKQKALEARDKKIFKDWAEYLVRQPGIPIIHVELTTGHYEKSNPVRPDGSWSSASWVVPALGLRLSEPFEDSTWALKIKTLYKYGTETEIQENLVSGNLWTDNLPRLFDKDGNYNRNHPLPDLIFPNYQDYGYGIFLLDEKSRAYVLANIQSEKDDFLRSMMWGSLWDSVRETELAPEEYVRLVIKNINVEQDESTIATLLNRVSTAMNYYLSEDKAKQFAPEIETLLIEKMQNAPTLGERITFYRSFVALASTENAQKILKDILSGKFGIEGLNCRGEACPRPPTSNNVNASGQGQAQPLQNVSAVLKTKDKFDIVTKLITLSDADGLKLLAELEKTETSDAAKRYAYAARAGIPTKENKAKYWNDFVNNKEISESYIESAFAVWNTPRQSELTLPYLEKALAELPNLKRNRKIFFVNNWLAAFIGGQKSEAALKIINNFLENNPNLDKDLRLKILENVDNLERAVKIREKFGK